MKTKENTSIIEITNELVVDMIHDIRGLKVMLVYELAKLYGYETKYLNRQVQRNIEKFPEDFMFRTPNGNPRLFNCRDENEPWLLEL